MAVPVSMGIVLAALAFARHEWNFDALGYASAARSYSGEAPQEVRAEVYSELQHIAPARAYADLTRASEYRRAVHDDLDAFRVQLPFYGSKPAYVAIVAALAWVGVNAVTACFAVSAVAYGALATIFAVALERQLKTRLGWLLAATLALAPPMREVGGIATPDALSALTFFGAIAALAGQRRVRLACALLVLAVAVRPDNLAFALAITLWIAGVHTQRRVAAATAIASASLFVVITRTLAYPWHVIIAHTFVERLVSPQQVAQARVRLDDYVRLVALGTRGHFTPHRSTWPLFLLLTIAVIIGAAPHRKGLGIKDVRLLGLIWLSCVAHFIAFPMLADRFFIAQYLAIVFIAACWFRPPSAFATASPR